MICLSRQFDPLNEIKFMGKLVFSFCDPGENCCSFSNVKINFYPSHPTKTRLHIGQPPQVMDSAKVAGFYKKNLFKRPKLSPWNIALFHQMPFSTISVTLLVKSAISMQVTAHFST